MGQDHYEEDFHFNIMGNETSHAENDNKKVNPEDPTLRGIDSNTPSEAMITRHIEWQFTPNKRHYSPSVEAFGLKWYVS